MLAAGVDINGCDSQGEQHRRGFCQLLSPGPSKCPTVCQALHRSNLPSTFRGSWWERQGDPSEVRMGCVDTGQPGGFLEERVSKARPGRQAEIAWVFKAWGQGRCGASGVGACSSVLIPQLPRLGRAHPAHRPSRLHSCGHPQGLAVLAAFERSGS